jgi:DNA primase
MQTLDVARSAGLDIRQRGSRWWACCPLHSEHTPSFCVFPDGRWKCFGCGKHGDAADLYAALYGVSIGEALRAVRGNARPLRPPKPTGSDLRQKVEEWKSQRWHEACIILHAARVIIAHAELDSDHFWNGAAFESWATDELNALSEATPSQLVHWMNREARP